MRELARNERELAKEVAWSTIHCGKGFAHVHRRLPKHEPQRLFAT
jgi:hypothetical protein